MNAPPDEGIDTIRNFRDGIDSLILENGLTFGQLSITDSQNRSTEISIDDSKEVLARLTGVSAELITEADFSI